MWQNIVDLLYNKDQHINISIHHEFDRHLIDDDIEVSSQWSHDLSLFQLHLSYPDADLNHDMASSE